MHAPLPHAGGDASAPESSSSLRQSPLFDRAQWNEHWSGVRNLAIAWALLLCGSAAVLATADPGVRWPAVYCAAVGGVCVLFALALHRDRLGPVSAALPMLLGASAVVAGAPLALGSVPDIASAGFPGHLVLLLLISLPLGLQAFGAGINLLITCVAASALIAGSTLLDRPLPLDSASLLGGVMVTIALQGTLTRHRRRQRILLQAAQDLALLDPLTDAYQRSFFLPLLAQETLRSSRMRVSASLLLVDIDHLSQINLTSGNAAGDRAIQSVVERIRGASRGIDVVGRLSGATLAVLLPGSSLTQAGAVAERIRAQVERSPVYLPGGQRVSLTVSIGVSQLRPQNDTETLWLSRTDMALHRAKAQGKNRVALDAAYFAPGGVTPG